MRGRGFEQPREHVDRETCRGVPEPRGADVRADREARPAEVLRGQRRAHGARVQDGAARVQPGIDARHHDIGRIAERAEAGRDHAHAGRAVERVRFDPFAAGQLDELGVQVLVRVHEPDRGARSAAVGVRCDHEHIETRGREVRGQHVQPF